MGGSVAAGERGDDGVNWVNTAHELNFGIGPVFGGLVLLPYQLAVGLSLRYLPCIHSVMLRVYAGPFKDWLNVRIGSGHHS